MVLLATETAKVQIQIQISVLPYISVSTREHKYNTSKYISQLNPNHHHEDQHFQYFSKSLKILFWSALFQMMACDVC